MSVKRETNDRVSRLITDGWCSSLPLFLKLKLKTNLYSAIKSEDSEVLDGGTGQLSSQREYGEINNVLRRFLKAVSFTHFLFISLPRFHYRSATVSCLNTFRPYLINHPGQLSLAVPPG